MNQRGKDAYPIVGLTWLVKKGEKMTSTLHYTPLPDTWSSQVEKTIKSINVAP
ncbi:hypothetical protein [Geomonas oryzisoli]|uniref:hypothetical protein n=1 Tax=Geomonas oryzisoli TaxID=2847992 RepID=UPI003F59DD3F